jgi:hypothetical protein
MNVLLSLGETSYLKSELYYCNTGVILGILGNLKYRVPEISGSKNLMYIFG